MKRTILVVLLLIVLLATTAEAATKAELAELLTQANAITNDGSYSAETWESFVNAKSIAQTVLETSTSDENFTGAYTLLQTAIDGLGTATPEPIVVPADFSESKAEFALAVDRTETYDGDFVIAVYAADAAYIANALLQFEFSPDKLEFDYVTTANGFLELEVLSDSGEVSVDVMNPEVQSAVASDFTYTTADTVIFKLHFKVIEVGSAEISVTSALAAAIDTNGLGADISAVLPAKLSLTIADTSSNLTLDFNGDHKLSLADLATLQKYYKKSKAASSELQWSEFSVADFNGDEEISVADFLIVLQALREAGALW